MSMEGGNGPIPKPNRRVNMNTEIRELTVDELDAVSGGVDGPLAPVIIHTINTVLGTNIPGGTIDPPPAPCHPK
jgi:hypothetical protein